ncbi:MAG: hypothetical protein ACOYIQ_02665 [Christensenellales bacterium]|jgi:ABC-2 type transport system permease protein
MTFNIGYTSLLKVLIKDKLRTGTFFGFKKSDDPKKKSVPVRLLKALGIGLLVLLLSFYLVMFIVVGAVAAVDNGVHKEFLTLLISASQLIVFFFGISAVMGYLYFSKDNSLLSSLPIPGRSVFLAKFSMAYVAEFVISAYFLLVSLITYAVTLMINGVSVGAEFFVFSLLCIIAAPIIPLLIITFISIPVMRIVRLLKRNPLVQSMVVSAIFIGIMAAYFGAIKSFVGIAPEDGEFSMPPQLITAMSGAKKVFFFNMPIVEAMTGNRIAQNTLIYLAANVGGLGLAVVLSSFFYSKSIRFMTEGSGTNKAKGKIVYSEQRSLTLSFLNKELKTLFNTPMLFMQSVMGVVMAPLISLVLGSIYADMGNDMEIGDKSILFSAAFILYLASLMSNATNMIAMIGFSREGKHLFVLKSLPISAKQMVDSKLHLALLQGLLSSFLVSVVFVIKNNYNVLIGLGVFATLITISVAMSSYSLYNDLRNPNLNWKNITELTKNNKKSLKPALTIMALGMGYLVLGSVFSFVEGIPLTVAALSYFAVCVLLNCILIFIFYRKLYYNPEELLKNIEG